jgi:plastocyanin
MRVGLVGAMAIWSLSCGDSQSGSSPSPGPNQNTITISASGVVSPKQLTVAPGTRVLFVNSHSARHDMTSDPHPDHLDCPELNQVGLLNPGQSRETGNLVAVRTCGFHDHNDPNNADLRGAIVIR